MLFPVVNFLMLLQKSYFQLLLLNIDISQGSVATRLMCGGIFSNTVITNFITILTVKQFEKWSISDEVIRRTKTCAKFLGHSVGYIRQ